MAQSHPAGVLAAELLLQLCDLWGRQCGAYKGMAGGRNNMQRRGMRTETDTLLVNKGEGSCWTKHSDGVCLSVMRIYIFMRRRVLEAIC